MSEAIPFEQWQGWKDPRFFPKHFYQTKEWFQVLSKTWPFLHISILIIDDNAALPIFSQRRGFLHLAGSPLRGFFTPYGGYLGIAASSVDVKRLVKADFCEVALLPAEPVLDKWDKQNTIIVDLNKGIDALWAGLEHDTRNQVRQAVRNNVVVQEIEDPSWVEPYLALFQATYARQQLPPPAPKEFYENIARILVPAKAKILLAYCGETVIAGGIFCFHADRVYFLDGASDRTYQKLRPNNLIQWRLMQWAVELGYKSYDMIGANIQGIARFKRGFGGVDVAYPVLSWTPTLAGKLAWRVYSHFRTALKKLQAWRAT